jgi:hypothetical protein
MELGQPWALVALLSVPAILALYMLRPRRRSVDVPALALWQEALRERERGLGLRRLLRNLALLLLLAAALASALALAVPRWLQPVSEQRDAVVVLDVSASMQATDGGDSRFRRAREQARRFIDGLPDGARVLLVATGRHARLRSGFEADRALTHRLLDAERATDEVGRPRRALTLALSLLRSRGAGEVHFFTDAGFDDDQHPGSTSIVYHVVEGGGDPPRNVAITHFDFRAEPGRERGAQVLLGLRNYTAGAVQIPARVTLDGQTLFDGPVSVAAEGRRTLVLPYDGRALGVARARIDARDDLAADDRAFAARNVEDALRVAVVGVPDVYLDSVLRAVPRLDYTRHEKPSPEALAELARRNDVVVVNGIALPALPPGRFLLLDSLPPSLPLEDGGRVDVTRIDSIGNSALVQGVDLAPVQIRAARSVRVRQASPGVQPLFGSGERHLAAAVLDGQRRIVYLGFDLTRTDLPLQPAFPLFFARVLDWLRPPENPQHRTQIAAGEPYLIRVPATQPSLIMRTPSGDAASHALRDGALRFEDTAAAGIYRYTVGGVRRYFAVNLTDSAESDLRRRAALPSPPAASDATRPARASQPLWPWLCMAALLLLTLEWLLRSLNSRAER